MKKKLLLMFITLLNAAFFLYGQATVIKPGDAIRIYVHDYEDLCQTLIVNNNGTIDYPLVQGLPVDGISLAELQQLISSQISKYYDQTPIISVQYVNTYPIRVEIIGQVITPGIYDILNTTSLLGAVGRAGGFTPGAQLSNIKLIRHENGLSNEQIVNLEQVYLSGDPSLLPELKNEDIIFVAGNPGISSIKVMGSVRNPGTFEISFPVNIIDILYLAGGPTNSAKLNEVYVVSNINKDIRQVQIDIQELIKKNSMASLPTVRPGDIIYVPEKSITWSKFISVFRDLTVFVTLFYLISVSSN
jgi:polysaccharide export outer membrane protein